MDEPLPAGVPGGDAATAVVAESRPRAGSSVRPVCPFLISSTGDWRLNAPTTDHRCSAFVPLTSLSLEKQARLCLTAEHVSCATFTASVAARATRAGGTGEPVERVGRWGFARTAPLIEDAGGLRGTLITMIADRRTWPAIPAVLLVATLLAVGISGIRGEGQTGALGSPTPATTTAGTAPPSAPPATGEATLEPSLLPSSAPSLEPSIAATPAPSFRTYTVKSGDTLSAIAAKYNTTVSAIAKLNNITDPRKLHVGQVLKIPN